MLQGANTDLFNPLVHKVRTIENQTLLFPLQMKPLKDASLRSFIFCTFGANGLTIKIKTNMSVSTITS